MNFCGRSGGVRNSGGPSVYSIPLPFHHYPHTASDPSLPLSSSIWGRYRYRTPFDISPPPTIMSLPPTLCPSPPLSPVQSPSQTESVVGSLRGTSLSPITERTSPSSTVPPPPAFGRAPANGPLPSTSSIDTLSTPSRSRVPTVVPQNRFSVSTAPTRSEQPGQQQMTPN